MKILALESSAVAASVAVTEDEKLLGMAFQNSGLTHSRTLMPIAEDLLKNMELALSGIDLIAVAAGPGSFTGLRIGVSAAKGLAWAGEKPCCAVSTLEAMAWSVAHMGGQLCPVMDARRKQIYNGRFEVVDGVPIRIREDRATSLEALCDEIIAEGKKTQILVGDGAGLCYNRFQEQGLPALLPPPHLCLQNAWGVARAALEMVRQGKTVPAAQLVPEYHRLSQAERERLNKEKRSNDHGE